MHVENKWITGFSPGLLRVLICLLLSGFALISKVLGQEKVPCNQITGDMGFTVRSVIIKGRWVSKNLQQRVEEVIGLGDSFDSRKVSTAMELVRTELVKGEEQFVVQLVGSTSVLLVTSDVCDVSDDTLLKQAEIVIRPFYLRIDLYNLGENLLPIPHTANPTFYLNVPALLLATAPRLGLTNDTRYGLSANIQTTTDLLHLPARLESNKDSKKFNLYLGLDARKALNQPYHFVGTGLDLVHPVYTDTGIGWNIGLQYAHILEPVGLGDYKCQFGQVFAGIHGSLKHRFLHKFNLGATARFLQNHYELPITGILENSENSFQFHSLGDGRIGQGFTRVGMWFNAGAAKANDSSNAYQQLAGRLGYAITLGQGHSNVDLETNVSLGYSWGLLPIYSEFFAGNTASNFLYTPLNSVQNLAFPEGPVVRSLGERQGGLSTSTGVSGGTSYWGLNVSLSIPISKWSKPVIPDIVIDEERGTTARNAIKGQVNFAKSLIELDLVDNRGLSDEEADIESEKIVNKDIKPALNYLADRANLYSIKPILLFDLAGVRKRGVGDQTWGAVGAGLQLNIVNARLALGFMQTIFPSVDKSKGNFLIRFTVHNFY